MLLALLYVALSGCQQAAPTAGSREAYFEQMNAAHGGGYLATYPLHDPDSCILKLKAEVPEPYQPWGCLSLWYHLPRTPMSRSFRMLELYETHYPHDTVRAFAQVMRAEFYVNLMQLDSASVCLQEADQLYKRLNRPMGRADVKTLEGRMEMYRNNFSVALDALYGALALVNSQDTTFSELHALLYHDISVAFERSGQLDKSRTWLAKIWNADASKLDNPWRPKVSAAKSIAMTYLSSQPDSSVYWANVARELCLQSPEGKMPNHLLYVLGRSYAETGAYRQALPYLLEGQRSLPDNKQVISYYQYPLAIGKVYLELGQLDSAMHYLVAAKPTPDTGNLAKVYELMGDVYGQQQDYEAAWRAEKENFRLTKAKITSERIKAAADAEARYQAAQRTHRIQELETQQQLTRQKYFIALLSTLLALVALSFLYQRQRLKHKLLEQEKRALVQEKQLLAQAKTLAETNERLKTQELMLAHESLAATQAQLNATVDILTLKNQIIDELHMRISDTDPDILPESYTTTARNLNSMKILTPTDWGYFQQRFDEYLPGVLSQLRLTFPNLTSAETRLFLLIKLGFDPQEISETLGISRESVWRSRHRLSKKLDLPDTGTLDTFVSEFASAH